MKSRQLARNSTSVKVILSNCLHFVINIYVRRYMTFNLFVSLNVFLFSILFLLTDDDEIIFSSPVPIYLSKSDKYRFPVAICKNELANL